MINLIKNFVKFKKFLGSKIYVLLGLTMVAGFVEGVGIALFLPILNKGFGEDKLSLALKGVFGFFHIGFSFTLFLALILLFFVIRSVFLIYYARYSGKLTAWLVINLRRKVMGSIFKADYVYLLKKEVGYLNNAMVREVGGVVEAFTTFTYLCNYVIYALIYCALSLLLNPQISLVVIVMGPIAVILMRKLNVLTNKASVELSASHGKFHSIVIQALSKIKYLKATQSYDRLSKTIDKENKNLGNLAYKLAFFDSLTRNSFEPILVLVVVGLLFYYVVVLGRGVSEVIFLAILFLQIARQFMNAQSSYRRFLSSMGSIETFDKLEKELEDNKEDTHPSGILPDFTKEISLKDVSVVFPNGKKALEGINVNIRPASIVAFVGHSGSGKSTIANVITGVIKPASGEICLGEASYDKINLETLRRYIGYVTQEDIIFNANIKNNISLWDENLDRERLVKAAETAYMGDFLNGLPDGYDAMLGDNGLDISGGQRQRVTIARELYKDARLLILDEATSALDAKYEKTIYENLKEYKGKKTMVVIAHRLSTIKNADYIYVMDEGRIVEGGTFENLYNDKSTKFYNICQLQTI